MKFFSVMEFCFFLFLVNSSGRFPVCIFRTNYIILRNVEIFPPHPLLPPKTSIYLSSKTPDFYDKFY